MAGSLAPGDKAWIAQSCLFLAVAERHSLGILDMPAGGHVEDAEGKPLRYGKTETALRNPGFVAWGQRAGH